MHEKVEFIALSTELAQVLTTEQALHYRIIPKEVRDNYIIFYSILSEDDSIELKEELELIFAKDIKIIQTDEKLIANTLSRYYRKEFSNNKNTVRKASDDFLTNVILEAYNLGSSDIHIESYEDKCRVRIRIDGKLVERYIIKKEEYPAIINKIKIKANLDIAEKRLPQDGRISFLVHQTKFDIRVSILPTLYGEKIVLRLLNRDATNVEIAELGFSEKQLSDYLKSIKKPHGIILISGPTGSGKTTTLYATLKVLNNESSNVLTIEDPIEYTLNGINQVQLKEDIGLSFASALRTFLRQDPDIIMVGEIRDAETAQMAIRAALTGHLVLSTIHTNSAWGIVSRLIDMKIPSFLLSSTLNLAVAQRLIRLLCPYCKQLIPYTEQPIEINNKSVAITEQYIPIGCESCYYTGYRGRKAIFEIIPIAQEFKECIRKEVDDVSILIKKHEIQTLKGSALKLFIQGQTSYDEIYQML